MLRELLQVSSLGLVVLSGCDSLVTRLQSRRVARVGFLSPTRVPAARLDGLRAVLRDHGWEEGRTLDFVERYADGRAERLPDLATELVRMPADVIDTRWAKRVRGPRR